MYDVPVKFGVNKIINTFLGRAESKQILSKSLHPTCVGCNKVKTQPNPLLLESKM
ncbi:hypothetical protein HanHA300_Chr08g0266931 [Helianthus annuus]|nr:hypothetical protein HanHA300_Chr08g0266931 [Helianthus annuus]KAJ0552297.1 hypothetical protein HanHA89_Chr08g0283711 [Helianthus annuus]KAJ0717996.1 hypothetical protein HanLR1_Chr08g0265791 [Helianthus annuus]